MVYYYVGQFICLENIIFISIFLWLSWYANNTNIKTDVVMDSIIRYNGINDNIIARKM